MLALPGDLYEDFRKLELNVVIVEVQPTLIDEIRAAQSTNPQLDRINIEALA